MLGESHDILHEFPEHKAKIQQLATDNAAFADQIKAHDALDAEIRDLEEREQPTTDEHMEELKYKRTQLKDEIYAFIRANL